MIGYPLTVREKNNFKKGENYIVLCNHNALMDVPVSSPAIPGGNKTIAKIEMAKFPYSNICIRPAVCWSIVKVTQVERKAIIR